MPDLTTSTLRENGTGPETAAPTTTPAPRTEAAPATPDSSSSSTTPLGERPPTAIKKPGETFAIKKEIMAQSDILHGRELTDLSFELAGYQQKQLYDFLHDYNIATKALQQAGIKISGRDEALL